MPIRIPPARKPIQLYVWSKCGFCVKQKKVLDQMDDEMRRWFLKSVNVIVVEDPKAYPLVKGYPFWVVRGMPDPGFKNLQQIMMIRRNLV